MLGNGPNRRSEPARRLMAKLTDETRASLRRRSRLVNLGRDDEFSQGFINVPPFRGSTVLYPDVATLKNRGAALYLRHPWHAHDGGFVLGLDRPLGRCGNRARALGTRRDRRRAHDRAQRRRSLLITNSVYEPVARLRRQELCVAWGSRRAYYDPTIGAGIDTLMRPEHQGGAHRIAGLGDARSPGRPRDRRGRARPRRLRHPGQHLGDAALLLAARRMASTSRSKLATKYLSGHADLLLGLVSAKPSLVRAASPHAFI